MNMSLLVSSSLIISIMNVSDQFISKSTMSNLFHKSVMYHRRKLIQIFRNYFKPLNTDAVWTKDLPQQVMNELRLHLSWDLGLRTFDWSREAIGTRIIIRLNELGVLLFLKHVIVSESRTNIH